MRIAVTGASGFVGRQLIPRLRARGIELLVVGRDLEELHRLFPNARATDYVGLESALPGYDLVLHLAVLNNDKTELSRTFDEVNVELPLDICRMAASGGVRAFVFVSSTHALDEQNTSSYAVSKRRAAEELAEVQGIKKVLLYLPAVVGDHLAGKLKHLNRLPLFLRSPVLSVLACLKPTIHVDRLAEAIVELDMEASTSTTRRILADGQENNPTFRIVKRSADLAFSAAVLLFLWWAMILIWVAVKLQSPGPGIFRQKRVGRDEEIFTCLKFRTMVISAPNVGTHEAPVSAVTPLGHFLRRTKLDELPQVINILRNEMSLVGPRPCLPSQTELIQERRSLGVYDVKPGITGLAQVRGIDMSDPRRLAACDHQYVQLRSLTLDAKIILQTARGSGAGDNLKSDKIAL